MNAVAIAPPDNYAELVDGAPITTGRAAPKTGTYDFIHLFVRDAAELAPSLPKLDAAAAEGGMIWVSWPKKASPMFHGPHRGRHPRGALPMGLVDVKVAAVDADWSGLKLLRRKVG